MEGCVITHVDDQVRFGVKSFRVDAIRAIQTIHTVEVGRLTHAKPTVFDGLLIGMAESGNIHLPQTPYVQELPTTDVSNYVTGGNATHPRDIKSEYKQGQGALIRIRSTRPDIGFTATQMATEIVEACEFGRKSKKLDQIYRKKVRSADHRMRKGHAIHSRAEIDTRKEKRSNVS